MQQGHCKHYEPVLECKAGCDLKTQRFNAVPCFHADRPCRSGDEFKAAIDLAEAQLQPA